jgi:hypothetical protein
MVEITGGSGSSPTGNHPTGRRRAAGIYGAIITAATLAAVGDSLNTLGLTLAVLITLVVYWLAEEYAELLGEQVEGGVLPTRAYVRDALAATWPMVSASFIPLVVLIIARLLGASTFSAANAAIGAAIVLLTVHGWVAARSARLSGRRLVIATSIATSLGLIMVILKDLVLLHLH